jgi:hypothetical protein
MVRKEGVTNHFVSERRARWGFEGGLGYKEGFELMPNGYIIIFNLKASGPCANFLYCLLTWVMV